MSANGERVRGTVPAGVQHVTPVLMYHSVSSVPGGPLRHLAVPPALLAEQLQALAGAGYRLVGLTELLDLLAAGDTRPTVGMTFDDGYADFLTAGVPALAAANARATLYASVGHLGMQADWLGRWAPDFGRLLTWDELADVSAAGVEIGSHSMYHHPLDVLPAEQLLREVTRSRDELQQRLQLPIGSFAYPHGYHGRRVRSVVRAAGHDNATEVGRRLYRTGDDVLAVPRLQPTCDHTGADLLAMVRGGEGRLVPAVKRVLQPGWRLARRLARAAGKDWT